MFSAGYTFDEVCIELKKQRCKEWLAAFKGTQHLFAPNCKGFTSEQTWEYKDVTYYYTFLCLQEEFNFSDRHHAILAHEVIHCCTHHLSPMVDIVKENEAFAYTHTHILTQCYKALRDANKKRK